MMKIETKEDALLHCFDLWLWLALNPDKEKWDWPGWKNKGGHLEDCENDCPCCEYREYVEHKICYANSCHNTCSVKWKGGNCLNFKSEYKEWGRLFPNETEDRKKWALEIAILALEAME